MYNIFNQIIKSLNSSKFFAGIMMIILNIGSKFIKVRDIMSKNPKVITENTFVSDALKIINDYKITSLFIMKDLKNKKPSGIIHLHDCLRVKS